MYMKFLTLLLSFFSDKAADTLAREIKAGISPLAPYLRRISIGVVLILLSVLAWFSGLFFLLVSLFVYLSNLSQYLLPALLTSLTCFVVGFLFVFFGFRFVRRPR